MGMIIALGANWALTEILYDRKRDMEESIQNRVSKVVKHIDMPTILFFLGILMAVGVLQSAGILTGMAQWFDKHLHEPYAIAGLIGILSSVVDNVPLVAACMGMYPVADAATAAASADPAFMQGFVTDGLFWHLLSYCAGVGGSLLIIGSAAGVVAMGLEKSNSDGTCAKYRRWYWRATWRACWQSGSSTWQVCNLPDLGEETRTVDDETHVGTLADKPLGIAGPDGEGDFPLVDLRDDGRSDDLGAETGGLDMGDVHLGADGSGPSGNAPATANMAAFSISATMAGVAKTGMSPEPRAAAVFCGVTVVRLTAVSPFPT